MVGRPLRPRCSGTVTCSVRASLEWTKWLGACCGFAWQQPRLARAHPRACARALARGGPAGHNGPIAAVPWLALHTRVWSGLGGWAVAAVLLSCNPASSRVSHRARSCNPTPRAGRPVGAAVLLLAPLDPHLQACARPRAPGVGTLGKIEKQVRGAPTVPPDAALCLRIRPCPAPLSGQTLPQVPRDL
eukprot:15052531-Alexandrium_andersonii.AAC.1